MLLKIALTVSIGIFIAGTIYKISSWFRLNPTPSSRAYSPRQRLGAVVRELVSAVFSRRMLLLFKALILEVLLQVKALKHDPLRWLMHILILYGFMFLLIFHALASIVTVNIFSDYYSTLNPYLWLRNLFGAMVVVGAALAIIRRFFVKPVRVRTSSRDVYALILVAAIILSGFLLEATKITSYNEFMRMVDEYAAVDEETELPALEAFWVRSFGLVSPNIGRPVDEALVEQGQELHEDNCADCHAPVASAFVSYPLARIIRPIALVLDGLHTSNVLYWFHFLACLVGLALLPFSKMLHILTSPLSILVNAAIDSRTAHPAALTVKRLMELDACTHCGACSRICSVGVISERYANECILPSEKLAAIRSIVHQKGGIGSHPAALREGLYLCTDCHRCTDVCPVGIDLQGMWEWLREDLLDQAVEPLVMTPFSFTRGLVREQRQTDQYTAPKQAVMRALADNFCQDYPDRLPLTEYMNNGIANMLREAVDGKTLAYCVTCKTCTLSCPIPQLFDDPGEKLGLLPHQIIRASAYGLSGLVAESRMLWSCFGCYKCQERCPQGVRVTDVFFALKNHYLGRLDSKKQADSEVE